MLSGLPCHENAKVQNIHFYSCSDTVTAMEMAESLIPELLTLTEDGIEACDALTKQVVLVVCPLMCTWQTILV